MTSIQPRFPCRLALVLSCLMAATPAVAQWEDTQEGAKACKLAASRLQDADVAARRSALATMPECPRVGSPAIAAAWTNPSTDSLSVAYLWGVSRKLRDGRILSSVLAAARKPQTDRFVRLAAIGALAEMYNPQAAIAYREPYDSSYGGEAYVLMGMRSSPGTVWGPVPLPGSARVDILTTLRELGETDPDSVIRKIAGFLANELPRNYNGAGP